MRSRINRWVVRRLTGSFAWGAMVAGGCYGTVDVPGFSGFFLRGVLSIETLGGDLEASRGGLFIDFPGEGIEADRHGLRGDAPGVNIDIRRNRSNRHDSDDD